MSTGNIDYLFKKRQKKYKISIVLFFFYIDLPSRLNNDWPIILNCTEDDATLRKKILPRNPSNCKRILQKIIEKKNASHETQHGSLCAIQVNLIRIILRFSSTSLDVVKRLSLAESYIRALFHKNPP